MVGLFSYPKRKIRKLIQKGEYAEAINLGKSIEEEYSNDHDFMFIMGSAYSLVDDAEKALPYFEKAYQINNKDIETLTLKTNVHLALQQKDEAIKCCKEILAIEPKNSEASNLLEELEDL